MSQTYELRGHRSIPVPRFDKRDRELIALDTIEVHTFVRRNEASATSRTANADDAERR
jgi:hypothetical protein